MLTEVYISMSDKQKHLVVDGSLELLDRLLSTLRISKDAEPCAREVDALPDQHAQGQAAQEVAQ